MRSLKQSFNYVASSYEKYRPTYPSEMFRDIITYANLHPSDSLLEIGCGTGKATEGFLEIGYEKVTCIEYGANLANLTKEKFSSYPKVHVTHSSFEDWNSSNELFSLSFSGTAFHFIPPQIGYPKVATCLKKDGVSAFFWFVHVTSDEPVYRAISEIYKKHSPQLDDRKMPPLEEVIEERSKLTLESGHFHQLKVQTYKWDQSYTPEEYIGLLNTHSGHQVLPDDQKQALFHGIKHAILEHGGHISKQHVVALYLARKR